MNRQFERYLQITLILLDLIVLNTIYFLCKIIFLKEIPSGFGNFYLQYWGISNGLWILLASVLRTYAIKVIMNFEYYFKRTIQVFLVWSISLLVYLFFSRAFELSRLFIITSAIGFGLSLMINRFLYLGIKHYYKRNHRLTKKILILGYNETAKKLANYFEEDGVNTQVLGYIEDINKVQELTHYPVLGNLDNSLQVAKDNDVEEIYSTITPEQNKEIYSLMKQAEIECIRFKIVPNLSVFITREVHIEYFGDLPILSLRSEPLGDVGNRVKKRILDIAISLFVIIFFLSWMIPIFALIIFIESGESVFFKQLRTGKNKKPFYCLKFRSMKSNKDADLKQATANDARVTRIGKFIRKTSLDEFPQFINVLKGEMSIVGPRPHMLKHTNDYSKIVDDYMVRQFLKPGITGWAQIHGYRGEITNPEQIKLRVDKDLWYLENWNLWLDIQIIFMTGYYVFKGDDKAF